MEKAEQKQAKTTKGRAPAREKISADLSGHAIDQKDAIKLQKRISQLEKENKRLCEQIAALAEPASRPIQPYRDSVREQQHNFFKYSNARRY